MGKVIEEAIQKHHRQNIIKSMIAYFDLKPVEAEYYFVKFEKMLLDLRGTIEAQESTE